MPEKELLTNFLSSYTHSKVIVYPKPQASETRARTEIQRYPNFAWFLADHAVVVDLAS